MTQHTLALVTLLLVSCADDRAQPRQYDLTRSQDRALFKPHGLTFKKVVGPYAVYRVTGAQPHLVGPGIPSLSGAGLLTARGYFGKGKPLTLVLRRGTHPLLGTTLSPAADGDCLPPETPGDDGGGGNGGGGGDDAACDMGSHNQVTVEVDDAPMDAVVLIGQVSIGTTPKVADVRKICCDGDECVEESPSDRIEP